MRKKLLLLIFVMLINLLLVNKISAATEIKCRYRLTGYENDDTLLSDIHYELIHKTAINDYIYTYTDTDGSTGYIEEGYDYYDISFKISGTSYEITDINYWFKRWSYYEDKWVKKTLGNILKQGYKVIDLNEWYEMKVGKAVNGSYTNIKLEEGKAYCPRLIIDHSQNYEITGYVSKNMPSEGQRDVLGLDSPKDQRLAPYYKLKNPAVKTVLINLAFGDLTILHGEDIKYDKDISSSDYPDEYLSGKLVWIYAIKGELITEETDVSASCLDYTDDVNCKDSQLYACVWNETKYGDYCNTDNLLYVKCGDAKDIPYQVPQIVSFAVNFLKIMAPIILIITSIITLLKALALSEDEIKKAQKSLIRRIIAAVFVFLVITITQFVIMKVADGENTSIENDKLETTNISDCLNCLLNNNCSETVYYKTVIAGDTKETKVSSIKKK